MTVAGIFGVVVHEFHFDPGRFFDHVIVCEDIAVAVNHDAGAEALAGLILRFAELELAAAATLAEEPLEEVRQTALILIVVVSVDLLLLTLAGSGARLCLWSSSGCSRSKY